MCDKWKHVSVGACIWTIVACVLCLSIVFVPFFIETGKDTILTIKTMPIIGDGSFTKHYDDAASGFIQLVPGASGIHNLLYSVFSCMIYVYMGILIIDLIFAIILAALRLKLMRKIFKVFSIIFGFIMLLNGAALIVYIIGLVSFHFNHDIFSNFIHFFLTSGLLPILVMCVFSFIISAKQFKWFSKPYKIFA